MRLIINNPIQATEAFLFPEDTTPWAPTSYQADYRKCPGGGYTPIRDAASYGGLSNAVHSLQPESWNRQYGIYILLIGLPTPTIYIGIASEDARTPEGIFTRFKKHRVKLSGSHVGNDIGHGGVHHPRKWGEYAIDRYNHFDGRLDDFNDIWIAKARIDDIPVQAKAELERFEKHLFNNCSQILDAITETIWPQNRVPVRVLNHITKCKHSQKGDIVRLWDNREIEVHN